MPIIKRPVPRKTVEKMIHHPITAVRLFPAFLICFFLQGQFKPAEGGDYLDSTIRELLWLNFSGRGTECFERVGELLSNDPANYPAYLLRANCYGWFIAHNPENHRYDNPLVESLEACEQLAGAVKDDSPDQGRALYFKALSMVLNARFKALRGYNFTARWATRGAKAAGEELAGRYPEDIDARLPLAIFDATWGGSPLWQRMAQFTLLLPRGQREEGIRTLRQIAENGKDSKLWAKVVLLDNYLNDPHARQQALETAEDLHNLFPDNSVIQLELGECYRGLQRWVLAEAVYRSINAKVASHVPSYDDVNHEISRLRLVECQVNLGKIDEAFDGVRQILISNPINPEWVVPWAHLFTAKIYISRNQARRAERELRYALDGRDIDNLHNEVGKAQDTVKKMLEKEKEE
ncbi:MAG: hypothetical protein A3F83_11950 [Candidatus Glassbacteria bacterium RIFCSPLOWO2_12_FULL_58_11]|uniref:Tetratricopeptide repeat protein n=1 Tax=Candidatus Glassbacteria bacterium RIFCSPLOWO2_12_FULL_58_11 TaxID=1817867 RepID=A0A1F5YLR7_9BACT|nr:MAG: hypothetical protein A3F83_11950 [Candidatus Glassbacteria bacterium RIFCSPLOWO2_12_FULL_58_11]